MDPLIHWGTEGIVKGFHLLGLGLCYPTLLKVTHWTRKQGVGSRA